MGYEITKETVRWARTRVQQLEEARTEVGVALEDLEAVPMDLKGGAVLMEDQPESDMLKSFANDIEKLARDLRRHLSAMEKDLKDLRKGLRKYEEANHYDS